MDSPDNKPIPKPRISRRQLLLHGAVGATAVICGKKLTDYIKDHKLNKENLIAIGIQLDQYDPQDIEEIIISADRITIKGKNFSYETTIDYARNPKAEGVSYGLQLPVGTPRTYMIAILNPEDSGKKITLTFGMHPSMQNASGAEQNVFHMSVSKAHHTSIKNTHPDIGMVIDGITPQQLVELQHPGPNDVEQMRKGQVVTTLGTLQIKSTDIKSHSDNVRYIDNRGKSYQQHFMFDNDRPPAPDAPKTPPKNERPQRHRIRAGEVLASSQKPSAERGR